MIKLNLNHIKWVFHKWMPPISGLCTLSMHRSSLKLCKWICGWRVKTKEAESRITRKPVWKWWYCSRVVSSALFTLLHASSSPSVSKSALPSYDILSYVVICTNSNALVFLIRDFWCCIWANDRSSLACLALLNSRMSMLKLVSLKTISWEEIRRFTSQVWEFDEQLSSFPYCQLRVCGWLALQTLIKNHLLCKPHN